MRVFSKAKWEEDMRESGCSDDSLKSNYCWTKECEGQVFEDGTVKGKDGLTYKCLKRWTVEVDEMENKEETNADSKEKTITITKQQLIEAGAKVSHKIGMGMIEQAKEENDLEAVVKTYMENVSRTLEHGVLVVFLANELFEESEEEENDK